MIPARVSWFKAKFIGYSKNRINLLFLLAAASPVAFATWQTLLNNFVVERAAFSGFEIGVLQSLREIPGFLAFTVIYVLALVRQQNLAIVSLLLLGIGTALTGIFPSVVGLYLTTVLMSIGFHYLETMQISLGLQWLKKDEAPEQLGKIISIRSFMTLGVLGFLYLTLQVMTPSYILIYGLAGFATSLIAVFCWFSFPHFKDDVVQDNSLFLRRKYWLYYALTFMAGARRQIFTVFAGFLLVEKFGFPLENMVLLVLVNAAMTTWLAPKIGRLISRIGERHALSFEYLGLVGIFLTYAVVENATLAMVLYLADHIFFAMAIAISTYFQKIANPADISATAGISFTINHIAAVILPAALGILWVTDPSAVFLVGAFIAVGSLCLAQLIPGHPMPGNETRLPSFDRDTGQQNKSST